MSYRDPITSLATHEVTNQPPAPEDYNAYTTDTALVAAAEREGAGWARHQLQELGARTGSEHILRLGELANRHPPELVTFDRYGQRVDQVEFHPAYHELMALGIGSQIHSIAWNSNRAGAHVAHAAMLYLLGQAESGVCCPLAMTYASIPALRQQADVAAQWEPGVLSADYDSRFAPIEEKHGLTIGMAMTEKQGGSDVRANTTQAIASGARGPGREYQLRGHKWFCSAPMSDAFLTLANTDKGLSCFLAPRWRLDGSRNPIFIQRLKHKLGNHSNASSEIEYHDASAWLLGEEGRGVATIVEMVHHTRLDASLAAAALMRQAFIQAAHHTTHRHAFGKPLIEQPLMRNVLADLALESEAAITLAMRVARGFDESQADQDARVFTRLATALTKYWINKRTPHFIYEAMECLGGAGYVEESIMPRLYREAPLNSIWEGSGNVICLDVLRTLAKEPESFERYLTEVSMARGGNPLLDATIDTIKAAAVNRNGMETRARRLTELMALSLQAALLIQHAPEPVADAFCASRLGADRGHTSGTLPAGVDTRAILERALLH